MPLDEPKGAPATNFVTWALLPVLALVMAVSHASGAAFVAELGLAMLASTLGGMACALFWRDPAAPSPAARR